MKAEDFRVDPTDFALLGEIAYKESDGLVLNVNDLFAPCGDSETLDTIDFKPFLDLYKKYGDITTYAYVSIKRGDKVPEDIQTEQFNAVKAEIIKLKNGGKILRFD